MSSQTRNVVSVLAIVAVAAGFWFLLVAPKRADVSAANDRIAAAQERRDAAVSAAAQAAQARARYEQDYATVAKLGKAVPADDDVASLVYQLEKIARDNKIDFRAVKLAATGAPAAAATSSAAAANSSQDGDKAASANPAPAAPVVAQPPPGTVVGSAGLVTVPFTFTFDGGYMEMQRFLKAINGLANGKKERITVRGRLLTVDGFSLAAGRDGFPKVKALVSATAYLAPKSTGVSATATPQASAGASTATSTNTAMQGAGR